MKAFCILVMLFFLPIVFCAQNTNISKGNVFDGEPFLAVNPYNSQHLVVAWMGFVPFKRISIKTSVSKDGGRSWSQPIAVAHTNNLYGSADPSLAFDGQGNIYLCYVDFSARIFSGSVYARKSTDGGLSWQDPVEVIHTQSDKGQFPIDRPWISIDRSGAESDGNIYVTTMPPNVFGPLKPPFHPYLMISRDNGLSFENWKYLDAENWLAGNLIQQPMPTHDVAADGTFYAVYPSYVFSQNVRAQYILAASKDGGVSFEYRSVLVAERSISDSLAKKGYLLRCNPANPDHLAFFYLDTPHGDIDVFMKESMDGGVRWSSAIRLNDDVIGNAKMQDLLWADFDSDGDIVVSWRDRRNSSGNTYETASEIWATTRAKDAMSFSKNYRISNTQIAYDSILSLSGNDFMCIQLVNDTLNAVWGDTRNGKLNIWFQRMTLGGVLVSTVQLSDEALPSLEVFPNPFVDEIEIRATQITKMQVFSSHGRPIYQKTPDEPLDVFTLSLSFLTPGLYFIQVTTSRGVGVRRVLKVQR